MSRQKLGSFSMPLQTVNFVSSDEKAPSEAGRRGCLEPEGEPGEGLALFGGSEDESDPPVQTR